jgi:hypothetical protein
MAKAKKEPKVKAEKPEKQDKGNVFDYIKWLTTEKRKWSSMSPLEQKNFNPYIINLFLGMDLYWTETINELQAASAGMDKEMTWRLYYEVLPKQRPVIEFVKAKKIEGLDEKDIEYIAQYFQCTTKEAVEYVYLLTSKGLQEEIEKIKSNYL